MVALLAAVALAPLSFTPSPVARMPLLRSRQHSAPARLAQPQASLPPLSGTGMTSLILAVNDGESTRPARDLIENPAAAAYLVVLAILVGFLSFLAISDRQAKQRAKERAQRMEEDMQSVMATTQSLREQGKLKEASVLEGELKSMRRETKQFVASEAAKDAPNPSPQDLSSSGNRYGRRAQETEQLLADNRLADPKDKPKKQLTGAARARAIARAKRKADKQK